MKVTGLLLKLIEQARRARGLIDGRLSLTLCEFGDGMRGVALFEQGSDTPIERVALARWAVDQEDGLQYADKDAAPGWYYRVFGCDAHGCRLSNQAREALQDHCRRNEDAILAWCDGDTTAVLPAFGATNDATTFTTYIARPVMAYGQPGYDDALAAAAAINKSLGDSGESSFMVGDEAADHSAYRAMQRELDGDERSADHREMLDFVSKRLKGLFAAVTAPKVLYQGGDSKNPSGAPLFALYFAASNPNPKAFGLATKIAKDILDTL